MNWKIWYDKKVVELPQLNLATLIISGPSILVNVPKSLKTYHARGKDAN